MAFGKFVVWSTGGALGLDMFEMGARRRGRDRLRLALGTNDVVKGRVLASRSELFVKRSSTMRLQVSASQTSRRSIPSVALPGHDIVLCVLA